ncbi:MAG: hypothetical protein QOF24_2191 [Verrucomicrobiota bacterium]|jgi:hypothetical protein
MFDLLVELLHGHARYRASVEVSVSPESLGKPLVFIVHYGGERPKKLRGEKGSLIFG